MDEILQLTEYYGILQKCSICGASPGKSEFPRLCKECGARTCSKCCETKDPGNACPVCLNSFLEPVTSKDEETERMLLECKACLIVEDKSFTRLKHLESLERKVARLGWPCKLCNIPKMVSARQWYEHMNGKNHLQKLTNSEVSMSPPMKRPRSKSLSRSSRSPKRRRSRSPKRRRSRSWARRSRSKRRSRSPKRRRRSLDRRSRSPKRRRRSPSPRRNKGLEFELRNKIHDIIGPGGTIIDRIKELTGCRIEVRGDIIDIKPGGRDPYFAKQLILGVNKLGRDFLDKHLQLRKRDKEWEEGERARRRDLKSRRSRSPKHKTRSFSVSAEPPERGKDKVWPSPPNAKSKPKGWVKDKPKPARLVDFKVSLIVPTGRHTGRKLIGIKGSNSQKLERDFNVVLDCQFGNTCDEYCITTLQGTVPNVAKACEKVATRLDLAALSFALPISKSDQYYKLVDHHRDFFKLDRDEFLQFKKLSEPVYRLRVEATFDMLRIAVQTFKFIGNQKKSKKSIRSPSRHPTTSEDSDIGTLMDEMIKTMNEKYWDRPLAPGSFNFYISTKIIVVTVKSILGLQNFRAVLTEAERRYGPFVSVKCEKTKRRASALRILIEFNDVMKAFRAIVFFKKKNILASTNVPKSNREQCGISQAGDRIIDLNLAKNPLRT